MPHVIDRLHAVAETTLKPVTHLPAKLDAAAVVDVLNKLGLEAASMIAAKNDSYISINDVDKALSASALSLSDKMRFKEALSAHTLIARGKKVA